MSRRTAQPSSPPPVAPSRTGAGAREAEGSVTLSVGELLRLIGSAEQRGEERAHRDVAVALPTMRAAQALGICWQTFKDEVAPEVRCVRRNGKPLYPVRELERWADENADFTLAVSG